MATDTPRITEQGVATLPETWELARLRAEIIGPDPLRPFNIVSGERRLIAYG